MLELTQYLIKATGTVVIYDRARAFVQQEEMKNNLAAKTQKMCGKKVNKYFEKTTRKLLILVFKETLKETRVVMIATDGSRGVTMKKKKRKKVRKAMKPSICRSKFAGNSRYS